MALRFLLVALLVAACGPAYAPGPVRTDNPGTAYPQDNIVVWHDSARSVTCWVFVLTFAGGISCLPDSEIK